LRIHFDFKIALALEGQMLIKHPVDELVMYDAP
jgi:hypothetical protein